MLTQEGEPGRSEACGDSFGLQGLNLGHEGRFADEGVGEMDSGEVRVQVLFHLGSPRHLRQGMREMSRGRLLFEIVVVHVVCGVA